MHFLTKVLTAILIPVLSANNYNLYSDVSHVTKLTKDNFDKTVLHSNDIWIVHFYTKWSDKCVRLAPEFKKTAKAMKGYARFGAVFADDHRLLAGRYDVQEFPTVKMFGFNKDRPVDFKLKSLHDVFRKDANGGKTEEGMPKEVKSNKAKSKKIKSKKDKSADDKYEETLPKEDKSKKIKSKEGKSNEIKSKEDKYKEMKSKDKPKDDKPIDKSKEDNKDKFELSKDVGDQDKSKTALDLIDLALEGIGQKSQELLKPRLVRSLNVVELYDDNFYETVICSPHSWLVYFYDNDCPKCQEHGKAIVSAARSLKDKMKIGAMNIDLNKPPPGFYKLGFRYYPYHRKLKHGQDVAYHEVDDYESGITEKNIIDFGEDKFANATTERILQQITSEESLRKACESEDKCVMFFLPGLSACPSRCRNEMLDLARDMIDSFKYEEWGWVWTGADEQTEVEEALGISDIGYPKIAVVEIVGMTYYLNHGSLPQGALDHEVPDSRALEQGIFNHEMAKKFFQSIVDELAEKKKITARDWPRVQTVEYWCDIGTMLQDEEYEKMDVLKETFEEEMEEEVEVGLKMQLGEGFKGGFKEEL